MTDPSRLISVSFSLRWSGGSLHILRGCADEKSLLKIEDIIAVIERTYCRNWKLGQSKERSIEYSRIHWRTLLTFSRGLSRRNWSKPENSRRKSWQERTDCRAVAPSQTQHSLREILNLSRLGSKGPRPIAVLAHCKGRERVVSRVSGSSGSRSAGIGEYGGINLKSIDRTGLRGPSSLSRPYFVLELQFWPSTRLDFTRNSGETAPFRRSVSPKGGSAPSGPRMERTWVVRHICQPHRSRFRSKPDKGLKSAENFAWHAAELSKVHAGEIKHSLQGSTFSSQPPPPANSRFGKHLKDHIRASSFSTLNYLKCGHLRPDPIGSGLFERRILHLKLWSYFRFFQMRMPQYNG